MTLDLLIYLVCWVLFCLVNGVLVYRTPERYSITHHDYWRFLITPWKCITFLIAASGLILVAPYTGDPTWDYIDASFMAALTFVTAPWVVGILFLNIRRSQPLDRQTFLAICLWMFSASWSYDCYLLLRDGIYPDTWQVNIYASSVLYFSAGFLWNLDNRPNRGITFAFMEPIWFVKGASFRSVIWFALPFMMIAFIAILYFLI